MKNVRIVGNQNVVGENNNVTYTYDSTLIEVIKGLIIKEAKNQEDQEKFLNAVKDLTDNNKSSVMRMAAKGIIMGFLSGLGEKGLTIFPRFLELIQTLPQ